MSTMPSTRTWDAFLDEGRGRTAVGVVAFAVAAAFAAQVAVPLPFTPVPVTMQPLIVVLAGVILGARAGAISMAAYVTVGALGAPVFSNGGTGLVWLLGPTGGYLLAAPAAAFVAGSLAGKTDVAWRLFLGLLVGTAVMHAGGVAQLAALNGEGLVAALALGTLPFLVGDAVKIAFAFFAVSAWRRSRS